MAGILIIIVLMIILFKLLGLVFHAAGKVLGWILGLVGYLLLGMLGVVAFGLSLAVIPIVLVVGLGSLIFHML